MEREPISIEGYNKLREEIRRMEEEEMPKLAVLIADARAEGDLRENAEYHGQRENQGRMQAKQRPIPLPPIALALDQLVRSIARRHASIFERLGEHAGKRVVLAPCDLPFVFCVLSSVFHIARQCRCELPYPWHVQALPHHKPAGHGPPGLLSMRNPTQNLPNAKAWPS